MEEKANACKNTSNTKLNILPTTDKTLTLNILRAHYQTAIWKFCMEKNFPNRDPCKVMMRSIFS